MNGFAVDEVEGLGEVGFHFYLAGADGGAGGAAEGGEEIVGGVAVGDLDGARALGQAFVFLVGGGDLRDAVQQNLGADAADHGFGKVARVGGVGGVRFGGKAVGSGGADVADEAFEIVVVGNELRGEVVEQLGVGGRVRDADVIDGIDDADAHVMIPDDVDDIAGEPGVLRRGEPAGDGFAAGAAFDFRARAAEEFWGHVLLGDRVLDLAAAIENDTLAGILGGLAFHLCEKGGEAVVVVHRPAVEGVVVALGALDAGAHEDLRDVFRELHDIRLHLEKIRGGAGEGAALCGEKFGNELVEGSVAGDAIAQPAVEVQSGFVGDGVVAIADGADLEQLGPFHNPHLGELFAGQQRIHELGVLVRAGVRKEFLALLRRGREADDVEVRAAQEGFVAGKAGRDDAELVELRGDVAIDVVEGRELGALVV